MFQLRQQYLQVSWSGFWLGFGLCFWELLTILPEAYLWSRTLMADEKAQLTVSTWIDPKSIPAGWDQDSVQASQVLPPPTSSSMSLWTSHCALVMLEHQQTVRMKSVAKLDGPSGACWGAIQDVFYCNLDLSFLYPFMWECSLCGFTGNLCKSKAWVSLRWTQMSSFRKPSKLLRSWN